VEVGADVVCDGHEMVAAELRYGPKGGERSAIRMEFLGNDRHRAHFMPDELGVWEFQVVGWIDRFGTWLELFERRVEGGSERWEIESELREGAALLERCRERATGADAKKLKEYIRAFENGEELRALEPGVKVLAAEYDPMDRSVEGPVREILVERTLARFGSWYEFFPRSVGEPGEHGTLDDAAAHLDYVADMGFDIVYLPPIHPIGREHRKGKDNAPTAGTDDPGSPWAIGSKEGGHKSIHPELGGFDAFDRFMARADELGLDVALDLAYQCAPDHPWVEEHPEWFRHRPDGSIRYAENPPKKYQDIYPIDFESDDWEALWEELRSVVAFWADKGVRTFRVDNPHTKALPFWEWCFRTLREDYPDLIFLSEAFTRPKLMYALGKAGFSQSYTYFTWRYTKSEFIEYLTELTQTSVPDFYRPNFWPNTPDILPPYLRERPVFEARLVLASTLVAAYGIYGPAFELMANEPHPSREEYKDNEKYEIREWDVDADHSLEPLITRINRIRRENPALSRNRNLQFLAIDNEMLLAYAKREGDNLIVVVVNLDPHHVHSGSLELPLHELGLPDHEPYVLHDLIDDARYYWEGSRNYVELNPHRFPAHVFRVSRRIDREQDTDAFR
jgi:starch synthase (maltosyl-transferring)